MQKSRDATTRRAATASWSTPRWRAKCTGCERLTDRFPYVTGFCHVSTAHMGCSVWSGLDPEERHYARAQQRNRTPPRIVARTRPLACRTVASCRKCDTGSNAVAATATWSAALYKSATRVGPPNGAKADDPATELMRRSLD